MRNLSRVHAGRPARFAGLRGAYAGGGVTGRQVPEVNAAYIKGLSPAGWYRWGIGITVATGVSVWADRSGNGRDLTQGTGSSQPTKNSDGSILFNGSSHWLQALFTYAQPFTYYLLVKQVTWVLNARIADGGNTGVLIAQSDASPRLTFNSGVGLLNTTGITVGVYGVVAMVGNSTSSVNQCGSVTATGDAGTTAPGGFTLGAARNGAANWANIEVREVILFASAHNGDTRRNILRYLRDLGKVAA